MKSAKAIWDYLKVEYEGDERIRGMQVLNLTRDFKLQKLKESKLVKEYANIFLSIANTVRLLKCELTDSIIVEKLLIIVLKRFNVIITTLENIKDLSKISLTKFLNGVVGALPTKHFDNSKYKKKKNLKNQLAKGKGSSSNY